MTTTFIPVSPMATVPVRVWSGRTLGVVVGGFLAAEGLARVVWGSPLVTASERAPTLEPSLQLLVGLPLLIGAGLQLVRAARWPGAVLMLLSLAALIAVEFVADIRSPGHILFWAYAAALLVAGLVLRTTPRLLSR